VEAWFHRWLDALGGDDADDGRMNNLDVVTVRGLRKRYDDRTVVDGLDLDVGVGEIVGLIGTNGAGKTTAVECIQGIRRPDGGEIRVLGFDPTTQAEKLRPLIGSQLQDSALPDRLRVGEAVHLFGSGRPGDGDDLLGRFGLDHVRRSAFAGLSGGERQRLFLVLALLNRPRLVFLDELTQGLDPSARRTVWAAVDELRADGTSVLLVTHELDEAEALCDRVVAMRAGVVLDSGTPRELIVRHGGRATIRFTIDEHRLAALGLERLQGVDEVLLHGDRVTIRGQRTSIAHIGCALVHAGPVPADLSVEVPDLEDALVELLQQASADDPVGAGAASPGDLVGAQR
jgi:ABC-2 type transport system ATP-binding protein